MSTTSRLLLPLLSVGQAGKETTVDASLLALDNAVVLNFPNPVNPVIAASSAYGSISIGSGSFAGGAVPAFQGNAAGTGIAVNTAAGFAGDLFNLQVAGVQIARGLASGAFAWGNGSGTPSATFHLSRAATTTPAFNSALRVDSTADTARQASTEFFDVLFTGGKTITWNAGAISSQRFVSLGSNTIAFSSASTVNDAATLYIQGAPLAGTNATLTRSMALWVAAGQSRFDGDLFHKGTNLGFYNVGPVARPAAYTLAGAATRTFPTDPSGAYTGIATGVGGTPYGAVADLNTLRTAVSSLEGVVRQVVADLQAVGLLQ